MAISPQRLTIYLYSAHLAVIFAIAQLSCFYENALYKCTFDFDFDFSSARTVHLDQKVSVLIETCQQGAGTTEL